MHYRIEWENPNENMLVNGHKLSRPILAQIKQETAELKKAHIIPKIAIVTLGDDSSWKTYVGQKVKMADKLRIEASLVNFEKPDERSLLTFITRLNHDRSAHGVIVQRPLPHFIDRAAIVDAIDPKKDIDGFRSNSTFSAPVWLAVEAILKFIKPTALQASLIRSDLNRYSRINSKQGPTFTEWLKTKKIVVIGKGETGGGPVIKELNKQGATPIIVDSKTKNKSGILKEADIVITGVGKRIVAPDDLKKGVVLIGIGIHRGEDGKLHGDYDEQEVKQVASYYTPTPGGVGPLNLAYLFKNLVKAARPSRHPPDKIA